MSVVLDTHAAVWYALGSPRLSAPARQAIDEATRTGVIYLPAISIVEIVELVEKGRLPQEALDRLLRLLSAGASPVRIAPLDLYVAEALPRVPRAAVPDMPDRIIAATALHLGLPLVTRDSKIQAAAISTIW